ncbi:MAG: hypothetical protein JNK53_03420, partial [Phycisphaerae bacterium]|nr:hypothetical protein [Phycisphaerae bacterium]
WAALAGVKEVRFANLPLGPSRTVNVVLSRIDPFTDDAVIVEVVDGPDGKPIERALARPQADFFAGIVEGEADSRVLIARTELGVSGYVHDSQGTYVLSNGPAGANLPLLSYSLTDLPEGTIEWSQWGCGDLPGGEVFMNGNGAGHEGGAAGVTPCRQVRIAVETDNEFTATLGNSTAAAAYAATIFSGVLDIYSRDVSARPQMSYLRLWVTTQDPWTATSSGAQLDEFRNYWLANMGSTSRNVAHMMSTRSLGGGVAYLSSLCNTFAYGVSGSMSGYFPYPLVNNSSQNWDIIVVAHELGHNFGAPHTHNYCPPADQCAPSGYFGSCQTQQVCINTGTIMSYCHLCSGGTGNIQLLFHPQNIASITSYLDSNGCTMTGSSVPPAGNSDSITVNGGTPSDLDVLANDVGLNCEAIQISSAATTSLQGGTIAIVPGAGPSGRDILRYTPPASFGGGLDTLWYRLTDASNQTSIPINVSLDVVNLRAPENPVGDVPALDAKYYVLSSPTVLPNYAALTPYLTTTVPNINYASTNGNFANSGRSNNVGAQWTGWVLVDQPGMYTFFTTSDDGSSLLIGSTTVVNNDGLHGMTEKSGTIGLLPGKHAITVNFFEAGGGAGCIVQLSGPGIAKAAIPASRFTRGGTINP